MASHQKLRAVQRVAEVDEAIVGDGSDPTQRNTSSRVIEDDFKVESAALESIASVLLYTRGRVCVCVCAYATLFLELNIP